MLLSVTLTITPDSPLCCWNELWICDCSVIASFEAPVLLPVALVYLAIQLVENNLLVPRVQGHAVDISSGAVILLRRREPAMPRPYRTWGYPVTPVVFILFSGYLILNSIIATPRDAAVGGGLLLAGLPVYLWCRRRYATVGSLT